jgi:hypothetical protein
MTGPTQADSAAQVSASLSGEEKAAAKAAKAARKAEKAARKAAKAESLRAWDERRAREQAKVARNQNLIIAAVVVWQAAGMLMGFATPLEVAEDLAFGFVDAVFNGEPCDTRFC